MAGTGPAGQRHNVTRYGRYWISWTEAWCNQVWLVLDQLDRSVVKLDMAVLSDRVTCMV
jgi:hypothetical protein